LNNGNYTSAHGGETTKGLRGMEGKTGWQGDGDGAGAGHFSGGAVSSVCWSADNGRPVVDHASSSHLPVTEQLASVCVTLTSPRLPPNPTFVSRLVV